MEGFLMRGKLMFMAVGLVVLAWVAAPRILGQLHPDQKAATETAFDRVIRTGVLRCGYYVFAPVTVRDPNTGTLSGLAIDLVNQLGQNAGLKVEWAEEVDFGTWPAGLSAGRFDAVCTPVWPDAALARQVIFTRPAFYAGINAYARADDHRFDNNLAAINDPEVTIATIEGNATNFIAASQFPKAKLLSLPQTAPSGTMAENVVTKKADVFFWDVNGVQTFLASNPGSVRGVDPANPVKVMPFEIAVKLGESALRDLLDVGLQGLEDVGYTNKLLTKWENYPGSFYPLHKPYVVPTDIPNRSN
jgi:ABC-type amino acid transport substrate-binding protein